MAIYFLSFWSERKWVKTPMARKLFLMRRRNFHWLHNLFIKRAYRALQQRRLDATYVGNGEPATRKARRVNGRVRGLKSKLNPRQRLARRWKRNRRAARALEAPLVYGKPTWIPQRRVVESATHDRISLRLSDWRKA
jgi:hypothetical protein